MNDSRRDFASPRLASPRAAKLACGRHSGPAALACLVMACAGILNGCSWLGLGGGKTAPSKVESRQEAPKPDAFAQTRAQMSAFPREPYWPYHLAELYLDADSTTEAIGNLQTALTVNPDYAPAVSLLSRVYYDRRMHAQAVTLLEDYLSRNAQAPDALRASLALNYEALGEADKADAALASCATDSREADCARVLAMLRQNDRTAMLSTAQKALDDDKHSAANHNNYGIALLVAGRPFEARDEFRAALDLNDGLAGALYNMAIVESFYFFDDAAGRDWYTRYLRVDSADPDNLKAHFDADVSSTEPPADRSKP